MHASAIRFAGPARVGRATLLGTAVVLLTVVGHTASGSWSGSAAASLLLWPLAVSLSLVAADRRRSAAWLFAFAVGMQALFHVLLSIASGHGPHVEPFLPSTTMIVGHLGAAAATALVLAHGDRLMHAWLALWRMLACGAVTVTPMPVMRSRGRLAYVGPFVHDWVNCTAISRRGPPTPGS